MYVTYTHHQSAHWTTTTARLPTNHNYLPESIYSAIYIIPASRWCHACGLWRWSSSRHSPLVIHHSLLCNIAVCFHKTLICFPLHIPHLPLLKTLQSVENMSLTRQNYFYFLLARSRYMSVCPIDKNVLSFIYHGDYFLWGESSPANLVEQCWIVYIIPR